VTPRELTLIRKRRDAAEAPKPLQHCPLSLPGRGLGEGVQGRPVPLTLTLSPLGEREVEHNVRRAFFRIGANSDPKYCEAWSAPLPSPYRGARIRSVRTLSHYRI